MFGVVSCTKTCQSDGSITIKNVGKYVDGEFIPNTPTEHIGDGVDIDELIQRKGRVLDQACNLVPLQRIADALGVTPQEILLTDSTPRDANPTQSSCFFKWTDYTLPNAGIFLQMIRNPYPDEYPDYLIQFVGSRKVNGEQNTEGLVDQFKGLEGFGDDGAYSISGGKYFWRLGDKVVFHIAFNTSHTPDQQYLIATTIAKHMTENYING